MIYKAGEQVMVRDRDGNGHLATVVRDFDGSGMVRVQRHDGMSGNNDGTWSAWPSSVSGVSQLQDQTFYYDVNTQTFEARGYVPDGFDPEAHRQFLKNLGG